MTFIGIEEAQKQLGDLIDQLIPGEERILTRDGHPVARLQGLPKPCKGPRVLGGMEGSILYMAEDFNAPMELREADDDYKDARCFLLRPCMYLGEVTSLETVLALIHGVAIERYPAHGSGFLPGFYQFVVHRFSAPPTSLNLILLKQFGHLPWIEGCQAVLSLLDEWHALEGERQSEISTQS